MKPSAREISVEGFDAWLAATDREEAVAKAADEEGGPRLSLVPPASRRSRPRRSTASRWRTAASASPAGARSVSAFS